MRSITWATWLTVTRILATPVIVVLIKKNNIFLGSLLFILAALTDLLDGFVARLCNQATNLGAVLDPIADKILVVTTLGALSFNKIMVADVPGWFFGMILSKELLLLSGTALVFLLRGPLTVRPSLLGKSAMVLQVVLIQLIFYKHYYGMTPIVYDAIFWFVVGCVVGSFIDYACKGMEIAFSGQNS